MWTVNGLQFTKIVLRYFAWKSSGHQANNTFHLFCCLDTDWWTRQQLCQLWVSDSLPCPAGQCRARGSTAWVEEPRDPIYHGSIYSWNSAWNPQNAPRSPDPFQEELHLPNHILRYHLQFEAWRCTGKSCLTSFTPLPLLCHLCEHITSHPHMVFQVWHILIFCA